MIYSVGEIIQYRKWYGKVLKVFQENKTYMVELYHYRNYGTVIKQIDQRDLYGIKMIV